MEKTHPNGNDFLGFREILSLNSMVKIAFLSAVAYVVMLFEIPLMFFPVFLKIDLSDVPALIAGFAIGPMGAILVELVKNILHLITKTDTGGVGELANFIVGCALVVPAAIAYKIRRNKKYAYIGMSIGVGTLAIVGALANYFILIPYYAKVMPIEQIIALSAAANGAIKDMKTLVLYAIIPFNIIKGLVVMLITGSIYKKISHLFKSR